MNAKELAELLERLDKYGEQRAKLAERLKDRMEPEWNHFLDAAAAIRSLIVELQDGQELVALPWIVEYMRQDGGHGWKPMAAFDFETPAQNYANDCAKDNKTWEYRVVPAPIAPNAAQSDGEMVKDAFPIPEFLRGYSALRLAAQEFVDKVERGEAYSKRSYKAFKEALETIAASKKEET